MALVDHAAALGVVVARAGVPVARGALVAAELQPGPLEVQAEAGVEGHIAVVGVHVEAEVLADLVAHDEGVVVVEVGADAGEERVRHGQQELHLEPREDRLHADLVHHQAVVVHGVRAPRRQAARVEAAHLLDEPLAEVGREEREGVNLPGLLPHQGAPRLRRAQLPRAPERGVEPLPLPARRLVEERRVSALRGVARDDAGALRVGPSGDSKRLYCVYT